MVAILLTPADGITVRLTAINAIEWGELRGKGVFPGRRKQRFGIAVPSGEATNTHPRASWRENPTPAQVNAEGTVRHERALRGE